MMNMMNFQILLVLMTSVHAPPPPVIPLKLNHLHIHLYHRHQCNAIMFNTESQKHRRRVGIADQKVFAHPESFCTYLQDYP